jgi:hypothetical protein
MPGVPAAFAVDGGSRSAVAGASCIGRNLRCRPGEGQSILGPALTLGKVSIDIRQRDGHQAEGQYRHPKR